VAWLLRESAATPRNERRNDMRTRLLALPISLLSLLAFPAFAQTCTPKVDKSHLTEAGKLMLSVTNPDSGSAAEEVEVEYGSEPLDIGFNSRYLLDIAAQLEGEAAVLKLADPGSPTLIQDRDTKGALYVLMPMRV